MNKKHNIQEDSFIPDGLEFKEEYFEKVMEMYKRERLMLRWKKALVISGSVVAAASVIWFVIMPFLKNDQPTPSTQPVVVTNEPVLKPSVDETQTNQVEQSGVVNQNENLVQASMAGDHGVLASSGADSPDRRPNTKSRALAQDEIASSGAASNGSSPNHSQKAPGQKDIASSGAIRHDQEPVFITKDAASASPNLEATTSFHDAKDQSILATVDPIAVNASEILKEHVDPASLPEIHFIAGREGKFLPHEQGLRPNTDIKMDKSSRFSYYLGLGMNIWADYGRNKGAQIPAGYFLESGMNYAFHGGWSISAAPHYFYVSGLSNPVIIENTTYGQGFHTTAQTIFTNQLHYGGLQFSVKKNLNQTNQVYLGYGADYLISGTNTILTSSYSSYENYPSTQVKTKGYVKGFKEVNHSLVFGYQRMMGRYTAGVRGQFGLTDITKDGIFAQETKSGNSMVTICLGLNLHR